MPAGFEPAHPEPDVRCPRRAKAHPHCCPRLFRTERLPRGKLSQRMRIAQTPPRTDKKEVLPGDLGSSPPGEKGGAHGRTSSVSRFSLRPHSQPSANGAPGRQSTFALTFSNRMQSLLFVLSADTIPAFTAGIMEKKLRTPLRVRNFFVFRSVFV